jgi:hypothetical protein
LTRVRRHRFDERGIRVTSLVEPGQVMMLHHQRFLDHSSPARCCRSCSVPAMSPRLRSASRVRCPFAVSRKHYDIFR